MDPRFDPLTFDGMRCPTCDDEYLFPPSSHGRSEASWCPNGDGEGPTVDDFNLWCPNCEHFVSVSLGECPRDRNHALEGVA